MAANHIPARHCWKQIWHQSNAITVADDDDDDGAINFCHFSETPDAW